MSSSFSTVDQPENLPSQPKGILRLSQYVTIAVSDDKVQIRDQRAGRRARDSWCGLTTTDTYVGEQEIDLHSVLWVEVAETLLTITYAYHVSGGKVSPGDLSFSFSEEIHPEVDKWASGLLQIAYGRSQLRKRFKVILNPFGGKGNAVKMFATDCQPLLEAANCTLDVKTTEYSGHAITIAESLDIEAYDAVLCCSGDGVPHEVFNGLGKRKDALRALRKIAVCQLPGGSGNAMCWNLTGTAKPSLATLSVIKGCHKPIDLISITQGNKRVLSFLSQSFGIIADADLGTEHLRWMGGARFTCGLISRVWNQTVYPCDVAVGVAIDDKELIRDHFRRGPESGHVATDDPHSLGLPEPSFGSINSPLPDNWELVHHPNMGNFYAGNMAWVSAGVNFFPASLPNDGMFDLVCVDGTIGRSRALNMLLAVESGAHFDLSHVLYRKVTGYRIIPHKREGITEYISIDGERIPFEPFQAEVHSGLGSVLCRGDRYQAPGV